MIRQLSLAFPPLVLILSIVPTSAQQLAQKDTPEFVPQIGPDKACARVAFSPNGQLLITSSLNGTANSGPTLQLWETSTGRLIRNLRLQPRLPWSSGLGQFGEVAFSPDGQYVAFFERYALAGGPPKPNDIVQEWQTASVWEVSNGRQMIHSAWAFDSAKQAAVNRDIPWSSKQIEAWQTPASPQAAKWDQQHPLKVDRRSFLETRVVFSQDGRYVARVDGYGDLWSAHDGTQIPAFCASQVVPWKALSLSHNRKVLGAASTGKTLVVLDLEKPVSPLAADAFADLKAIAISPDVSRVATAMRADSIDAKGHLYFDGQIALWNAASLQKEHPINGDSRERQELGHPAMAVAFSPDGSRLVSCMVQENNNGPSSDFVEYQGLLQMWDPAAAKLVWKRVLPDSELSAVAFSPDGKLVATGHQGVLIKLYDATSSNRVRFFDDKQAMTTDPMSESGTPAVLSLAFSPDGKTLASGGSNGHLFVWEVQSGKQLAHLSEPHEEGVLEIMYAFGSEPTPRPAATRESVEALVFSADGKRLYSAGCDGAIKVWDSATWKQVSTLSPPEDRCIRALALSADGKWLISAGEDGQILFWDVASDRLSARLLIGIDPKQWLVIAANGLFDGTEDGVKNLGVWRVQNRLVSLAALPPEFRVRGLLQKILLQQPPSTSRKLNAVLENIAAH